MKPRPPSARVACALAALALAGCANYRAVSDFADRTTAMTDVVKSEFVTLQALCVEQAELVLVVDDLDDETALAPCAGYRRAQGAFAAITVDVLDDYADALDALVDDRPFDLSPSVRSAGVRVRALRDRGGGALVKPDDAEAVTRIAALLAEVLASAKRDDAVRRMVQATPDLAVMGRALRAYFVAPHDSPTTAPYANTVALVAGSTTSTRLALQSAPMRTAEPIRTAELLRALRVRQALLDKRAPGAADAVPVRIAAAIDAWLDALDRFAVDATHPDSRELIDRLKRLRTATRAARDAVDER